VEQLLITEKQDKTGNRQSAGKSKAHNLNKNLSFYTLHRWVSERFFTSLVLFGVK
jgi:hypothetical protein